MIPTFKGEPAVDTRDPQRECFMLLLKHISMNMSLFEGSVESLLPTHELYGLINKEYYCISKMIAAIILQGGPEPEFFCYSVAEYWLKRLEGVEIHVENISGEAQLHVKKVKVYFLRICQKSTTYVW